MPGQEWTLGSQHGFPERSCCLCGKAGAYVESGSMTVGNVHGSRGQPLHLSACDRDRGKLLRSQLVSSRASGRCVPRELMKAVRNGRRSISDVDGQFQVDGCRLKWLGPDEACTLLQEKVGQLYLAVDSLTRHLTQAILTVLAGDYDSATSALSEPSDASFVGCNCDVAYNDGHIVLQGVEQHNTYCRDHSVSWAAYDPGSLGLGRLRAAMPNFCPAWHRMHVHWTWDYDPTFDGENGTLLTGGGLHFLELNAEVVDQVHNRSEFSAFSKRICMVLHAPGSNKQLAYRESHGMLATLAFNQMIRDNTACQRSSDFGFESFAVTLNASSIDGQHYFQEANILLAQLLLNALDQDTTHNGS